MKRSHFVKLILVLSLYFASSHFSSASTPLDPENLSGMLVVVNKSDDAISLIDIAKKKIIKTLPTGKGPHELIVSADGKWAVSTDFVGGDSLTVFDLLAQKVTRTISLADYPGPHGIKFLKDQQRVLFTSGKSKHVVLVNIHSGIIEEAINTEQQTTHMLAFSQREDFAYTTNIRSNSISKISLKDYSLIEQLATEESPEAINISKDGKQLWYGANKEGLVTVIDTESKLQLAQFSDFTFPYRVLFSHNEKIAMVPDFSKHEIRFFDVKTLKELGKLNLEEGAGPQGITLHPVQDIAFLSLNLKNKIVAIDINLRQIIAEYPTGNNPDGVGFVAN